MAVQKLPSDIQSLFCASTQICSYKRAVEELVYNSLDAGSTSIAVRVNIEHNTIQVIDNGCGVSKCNFSLIGHRNATSKCVDLATLKSVPNKYGYRGQSLASIIEVSQSVNIASRCQDTEETWMKTFRKGKEQKLTQTSQRPSKGTTIEVRGFLYNLKIQKKTINILTELNDIKSFLEQLSLVHNNISLSLRDDTKNEIIFQLHKNRDIYQTLTSIFGIDRKDAQELKVEKNQYKVSAYIGIKDKEVSEKHWLYLNGKFLQNSKLKKIVNDNLIKFLKLNLQSERKVKSKNTYIQEEDNVNKSGIPFYFIFITCPYYDYDISYAPKQTVVEFKNWEPISKLIEKMAKFYAGDINLKEIKPIKNQENHKKVAETRDHVKKIMDKILGSNPKKIGVSQMQNGIKGKITKRKPKKKINKISVPKLPIKSPKKVNSKEMHVLANDNSHKNLNCNTLQTIKFPEETKPSKFKPLKTNRSKNIKAKVKYRNKPETQKYREVMKNIQKKNEKVVLDDNKKSNVRGKVRNIIKEKHKITTGDVNSKHRKKNVEEDTNVRQPTTLAKNIEKKKERIMNTRRDENRNPKPDLLLKIFNNPTVSVKKRCNLLANKVDDLMSFKKKRKRKIFINETVQYSNITKDNKNYSVRKKIGEIIIHEYIPKPTSLIPCTFDNRVWDNNVKKPHKSSYDLVQTILKTQETQNSYTDEVNVTNNDHFVSSEVINNKNIGPVHSFDTRNKANYELEEDTQSISLLRKLTYNSHNYVENGYCISHNYNKESYEPESPNEEPLNKRFITTQSKENFVIPTMKPNLRKNPKINHTGLQSKNMNAFCKRLESHEDSSYQIEFSKSKENIISNEILNTELRLPFDLEETPTENGTYTIERNEEIHSQKYFTYSLNHSSMHQNINIENGQYSKNVQNLEYIEDSTEMPSCSYGNRNCILKGNEKFSNSNKNNMNVVFISRSEEHQANSNILIQSTLNREIDALNTCETVHSQNEFEEHETNRRQWKDSLFNDDLDIDSFLCDRSVYTQRNFQEPMVADDISDEVAFNLDTGKKNKNDRKGDNTEYSIINEQQLVNELPKNVQYADENSNKNEIRNNAKDLPGYSKHDIDTEITFNFSFKNRHRFVPKGMSQIFAKCRTRNVCDYNLENEYYEEEIYNNFANNVQANCEILEPGVQNVKEFTTKAIDKVSTKVNKDIASLIFNGDALKRTKVLRQVDNKFVAAKIEGRTHQSPNMMEYLVLFDQHAVHERIRLESNLLDYFNGAEWQSVPLDNITLKLTKEETVYLHNFSDKFSQLGLKWTILTNGEVAINAIPEAILGKNLRQVEIVMKAVKNLIVEEINAIKSQGGCISLYPKTIMDLVFSEACRYAIKFGDTLSKKECEDLLNSLSECKTPFQCAHGRPVMAVLMDIKKDTKKYKIDIPSVQRWIKRTRQVKKK